MELLSLIHQLRPGILSGVPEQNWATIRRLAALSALWGSDRLAAQGIPGGYSTEIHLEPLAAARMLLFAASDRLRRLGMQRLPGQFAVSVVGDGNTCETCAMLASLPAMSLEDVPELPHPGCTSPIGCRCLVRWSREHRR